MKFKKLLNQKKTSFKSIDFTPFLGLTAYISVLVVCFVESQPIWPQIDNLSGVIKLSGVPTNDYFTESSIESPRVFTIIFIKFITLTLDVSPESTISFLGSFVAILGMPLFVAAAKKRISGKFLENLKLIEYLIYFLFLSLLSANYLHKIEVNGFFINPFLQGATTANLSIMLFLMGYLSNKKIWKWSLYLLSILFHISTGLFMLVIFNGTFITTRREKSKKSQKAIRISSLLLIILVLTIYAHRNLPSWSYYVNNRAANHFVITSSDRSVLQLTLLILSILCVAHLLTPKYRYKYIVFFLISGVFLFFATYPLYAVPYALVCLCLALKIREELCVPAVLTLLGLFGLQAFPLDLISIPIAMFLPATRFTSIVTLYLLCLLVLEIGKRARQTNCLSFTNRESSNQSGKIAGVLLIITIANINFHANTTNENFGVLRRAISIENTQISEIKRELIFLDVPSQGWREFGNRQVFVDEYPFWGNLNEYKRRNLFRDKILDLAFKKQLDLNEIEKLKRIFGVKSNLLIVTTDANLLFFNNFTCTLAKSNYWCDLEKTK